MKKTIILAALFILVISNLYTQNNINPPVLSGSALDTLIDSTIITATVNFNDTAIYKKNVTEFIRGWNYADLGRQLDKLNNINYNLHSWLTSDNYDWDHFGNSINWYIRISPVGGSYSDVTVCASYAMYYEPAITVDTTEGFTAGPENIDGAVFGFI
jgi:hypothetical protein